MEVTVPIPETYWDGFVRGVNFSIAGTGGPDCVAFIPDWQKVYETVFALLISFAFTFGGCSRISIVTKPHMYEEKGISATRQILLVTLCLTFGVEVGYKLSTSTVIWLANPCHLLTMCQIVLLAAPPRRWVTILFRITLHSMHGAMVALLLPVTNTRMLSFEVVIYWVQHLLIVAVPFFLLHQGGPYVAEPLKDWTWAIMSLGILYFLYWIPVQWLCILTEVNLNNMVCPAISDPFYGKGYRLWAMAHCGICILTFGKLYTYISLKIIDQLNKAGFGSSPSRVVHGNPLLNGNASTSNGSVHKLQ